MPLPSHAWQVGQTPPVPTHEPLEQVPQSRHAPPVDGAQEPLEHAWQTVQPVQSIPPVPQFAMVSPALQTEPFQQPVQQAPPRHWPPAHATPSETAVHEPPGAQVWHAGHEDEPQHTMSTQLPLAHSPGLAQEAPRPPSVPQVPIGVQVVGGTQSPGLPQLMRHDAAPSHM